MLLGQTWIPAPRLQFTIIVYRIRITCFTFFKLHLYLSPQRYMLGVTQKKLTSAAFKIFELVHSVGGGLAALVRILKSKLQINWGEPEQAPH